MAMRIIIITIIVESVLVVPLIDGRIYCPHDCGALLGVCSRVFPRLSERRFRMKLAPRYEWEQGLNWESVGQMMAAVKLPSELFDKGGLQACRFKPLYNFLVTLFFLHHVAADADFTADFTHPIDGPVAAYLQSRGAVETLIAGGAVSPDVLPGATPGRAAPLDDHLP